MAGKDKNKGNIKVKEKSNSIAVSAPAPRNFLLGLIAFVVMLDEMLLLLVGAVLVILPLWIAGTDHSLITRAASALGAILGTDIGKMSLSAVLQANSMLAAGIAVRIIGAVFGFGTLLWLWLGREGFTARGNNLTLRRSILGLGREQKYKIEHVRSFRVSASPDKKCGLSFNYGLNTIRFLKNLTREEADQIVGKATAKFPKLEKRGNVDASVTPQRKARLKQKPNKLRFSIRKPFQHHAVAMLTLIGLELGGRALTNMGSEGGAIALAQAGGAVFMGILLLRSVSTIESVTVTSSALSIRRGVLGIGTPTRYKAGNIHALRALVMLGQVQEEGKKQKKMRGIPGRFAFTYRKGNSEKDVRFGAGIDEPEATWLLAHIKEMMTEAGTAERPPASDMEHQAETGGPSTSAMLKPAAAGNPFRKMADEADGEGDAVAVTTTPPPAEMANQPSPDNPLRQMLDASAPPPQAAAPAAPAAANPATPPPAAAAPAAPPADPFAAPQAPPATPGAAANPATPPPAAPAAPAAPPAAPQAPPATPEAAANPATPPAPAAPAAPPAAPQAPPATPGATANPATPPPAAPAAPAAPPADPFAAPQAPPATPEAAANPATPPPSAPPATPQAPPATPGATANPATPPPAAPAAPAAPPAAPQAPPASPGATANPATPSPPAPAGPDISLDGGGSTPPPATPAGPDISLDGGANTPPPATPAGPDINLDGGANTPPPATSAGPEISLDSGANTPPAAAPAAPAADSGGGGMQISMDGLGLENVPGDDTPDENTGPAELSLDDLSATPEASAPAGEDEDPMSFGEVSINPE